MMMDIILFSLFQASDGMGAANVLVGICYYMQAYYPQRIPCFSRQPALGALFVRAIKNAIAHAAACMANRTRLCGVPATQRGISGVLVKVGCLALEPPWLVCVVSSDGLEQTILPNPFRRVALREEHLHPKIGCKGFRVSSPEPLRWLACTGYEPACFFSISLPTREIAQRSAGSDTTTL